jgi:hypothetical protein
MGCATGLVEVMVVSPAQNGGQVSVSVGTAVSLYCGGTAGLRKHTSPPQPQRNGDVHLASSEMIKLLAWLQKGRMWLVGCGLGIGPTVCLCSRLMMYDDNEHILTGCAITGAADRWDYLLEVWQVAAGELPRVVPSLPCAWLEGHRVVLLAALPPTILVADCAVPPEVVACLPMLPSQPH